MQIVKKVLKRLLGRSGGDAARRPTVEEQIASESAELALLGHQACDVSRLRKMSRDELAALMQTPATGWESTNATIQATGNIPGLRASASLANMYALYQMARHVGAVSVLEVGTNLGCSAGYLALAAKQNAAQRGGGAAASVTTVDIRDVNDAQIRPWLAQNSPMSPADFIQRIGCGEVVRFVVSSSLGMLRGAGGKYDLIFLDGCHLAKTVYQEVPALTNLTDGGIIVLHDYYDGCRPLYEQQLREQIIPGPYLAAARFLAEGSGLTVLPVGKVPMGTGNGRYLSLAVAVRQ